MSIPPERIRFLLLESCKLILRNAWMAAMCLEALNTSQYISYIRVNTPSSKCLAESGFAVPNFLPLPTQHRMKFLQSWCVSSHGHHPWPRDKPFLHRRFQFLAVDEAWEAPSAHGAKNGRNPTVAAARKAEWFHSQRPLATDKRIGIGKWSILTY